MELMRQESRLWPLGSGGLNSKSSTPHLHFELQNKVLMSTTASLCAWLNARAESPSLSQLDLDVRDLMELPPCLGIGRRGGRNHNRHFDRHPPPHKEWNQSAGPSIGKILEVHYLL